MSEFDHYGNKITTAAQHTIGSGRIMKITNKLRFVERVVEHSPYSNRILQQWWENINTIDLGWTGEMVMVYPVGEWRDVPIERRAHE